MGTTPFKPWSKSVVAGGVSLGEKFLPKRLLPVGAAGSLAEMSGDFAFFTPAVLYLYAQMTDEPLGDFQHSVGATEAFYHFRFPHPLFSGLTTPCGDADWNHVLWAVERRLWERFRDFYLSIMLLDPAARTAAQVACTDVEVLDSIAVTSGRARGRHTLPVCGFGIDGSEGRWAFRPSPDPTRTPPRLVRLPPDPTMVKMAAVYAGKKTP